MHRPKLLETGMYLMALPDTPDILHRDTLPAELQSVLLDQQLRLTSEAASPSSPYRAENKIVLRKLFSTVRLQSIQGMARAYSN